MYLICIFSTLVLSHQSYPDVTAEPVVVSKQRTTVQMPMPMSKLYPSGVEKTKKPKQPRISGCSIDCMKRMKLDIEEDDEFNQFILKQSRPYRFRSQFDETMLRKYCQKMNKTMNCVNLCPEGTVKTIALQALSLPKYMCIDTKFFEHAPCYKKVSKTMEKICHSAGRCGARKIELETLMNKQPSNPEEVNRLVQATCKYLVCFTECDRNEMVKECGLNASDVLDGLFAKSVQVMNSMFQTMRLPVAMPNECNTIMMRWGTTTTLPINASRGDIMQIPNNV